MNEVYFCSHFVPKNEISNKQQYVDSYQEKIIKKFEKSPANYL